MIQSNGIRFWINVFYNISFIEHKTNRVHVSRCVRKKDKEEREYVYHQKKVGPQQKDGDGSVLPDRPFKNEWSVLRCTVEVL